MPMDVATRELAPAERGLLLTHLLALDAEDRRLRFATPMTDDALRAYVDGIDFSRDALFVVTDADLAVTGAAHLARGDGHAEVGVSVLTRARGKGVASALLERCTARARNWGMRTLFMNCLAENQAMLHIARKQKLKVVVSMGEAESFARLRRASLGSLVTDAVAEHIGLVDHAFKSHWLALTRKRI